ncbi:hypothetical protein EDD86DRAFT_212870 [Gorgonomyces haynaldii]|nr:hypothetical protein EDD86DRAFT_212870 [Gorgonomyces haynaldii]
MSAAECTALNTLFTSFDLTGFNATNCCLSTGVECTTGRVTGLRMSKRTLNGPFPQLQSLTLLQVLDLSSNGISGSIPQTLAPNLRELRLDNNQLSGTIPGSVWQLTKLEVLSLGTNNLNGVLPSDIKSLSNLTVLSLSNNKFGGSIPPDLGILTKLSTLDLSNNQMTGTLPQELGSLTNLSTLSLSNNGFTGPVPNGWSQLPITKCDISTNNTLCANQNVLLSAACGILAQCKGPGPAPSTGMPDSTKIIIGSVVGGLLIGLCVIAFLYWRSKQSREPVIVEVKPSPVQEYSKPSMSSIGRDPYRTTSEMTMYSSARTQSEVPAVFPPAPVSESMSLNDPYNPQTRPQSQSRPPSLGYGQVYETSRPPSELYNLEPVSEAFDQEHYASQRDFIPAPNSMIHPDTNTQQNAAVFTRETIGRQPKEAALHDTLKRREQLSLLMQRRDRSMLSGNRFSVNFVQHKEESQPQPQYPVHIPPRERSAQSVGSSYQIVETQDRMVVGSDHSFQDQALWETMNDFYSSLVGAGLSLEDVSKVQTIFTKERIHLGLLSALKDEDLKSMGITEFGLRSTVLKVAHLSF